MRGQAIIKVLVINPRDNVALALSDICARQHVLAEVEGKTQIISARQHIPKGHKIALTRIPKGKTIVKYGEVIGYAKENILEGEHVHLHNTLGRDEMT